MKSLLSHHVLSDCSFSHGGCISGEIVWAASYQIPSNMEKNESYDLMLS